MRRHPVKVEHRTKLVQTLLAQLHLLHQHPHQVLEAEIQVLALADPFELFLVDPTKVDLEDVLFRAQLDLEIGEALLGLQGEDPQLEQFLLTSLDAILADGA